MNIISFRFEGVLIYRYIKFSQYHNFQTASQRSNPVLFCLILVQNNKNQTVHVFMASCCKSNDLWSLVLVTLPWHPVEYSENTKTSCQVSPLMPCLLFAPVHLSHHHFPILHPPSTPRGPGIKFTTT